MAKWAATNAKAKFSAMLDAAESQGPQIIHRRKQLFVVTTEEEIQRRLDEARNGKRKRFLSAWDAMAPKFERRYEIDFPRTKSKSRWVKFE